MNTMDTPSPDTCPDTASPAERFFYDRAGYATGRRYQGAVELAQAEAWLHQERAAGRAEVTWTRAEHPWDGDEPLPKGCKLKDARLTVRVPCPCCGLSKVYYESLGSVAYMPGDDYPRVVEAELALEMLARIARAAAPQLLPPPPSEVYHAPLRCTMPPPGKARPHPSIYT